jgi:hypothetical protein
VWCGVVWCGVLCVVVAGSGLVWRCPLETLLSPPVLVVLGRDIGGRRKEGGKQCKGFVKHTRKLPKVGKNREEAEKDQRRVWHTAFGRHPHT